MCMCAGDVYVISSDIRLGDEGGLKIEDLQGKFLQSGSGLKIPGNLQSSKHPSIESRPK